MTGITDLRQLIASMSPALEETFFCFITHPNPPADWLTKAKGVFLEQEGTTLILDISVAQHLGLEFNGEYCCITLNVHSSLEAVGLTAAFSSALASHNISANVVAGFYHDHIFVAKDDAHKAMETLERMSSEVPL